MKNLILIATMLFTLTANSQTITYNRLHSGQKPKGKFTEYISKTGDSYKIGDTLTIGTPSSTNAVFTYLTGYGMMGYMGERYPVTVSDIGDNIVIKKIKILRGNKKKGYKVTIKAGQVVLYYEFFLEDAMAAGEIIGFGMTSDQALKSLLSEKDKLDLGLISQEYFDKKKEELRKYIK